MVQHCGMLYELVRRLKTSDHAVAPSHKEILPVPVYWYNLMPTSNVDRRLERCDLLVVMIVSLEATFDFWVVAEDMLQYSG